LVITLGKDANNFLAPAAKEAGCSIMQFDSPFEVGKYLSTYQLDQAAVLFKGSQNGVFLEEAIKPLLAEADDTQRLVRQSNYWIKRKKQQFKEQL
jgi:UDP-N-acetylmuramoyl-tripeptide--D-alanyl-D-alanine ligase